MPDRAPSTPKPAPEELHWGISYLREDIQDLRHQIDLVHRRIDETNRILGEQIQTVHRRIDETNRIFSEQIQAIHHRIDETHKRMDSHFRWIMTTLIAITGILIAVIKL